MYNQTPKLLLTLRKGMLKATWKQRAGDICHSIPNLHQTVLPVTESNSQPFPFPSCSRWKHRKKARVLEEVKRCLSKRWWGLRCAPKVSQNRRLLTSRRILLSVIRDPSRQVLPTVLKKFSTRTIAQQMTLWKKSVRQDVRALFW